MVDTPGIPYQRWSADQKYLIIGPGVESDDFKLDSPVTDLTATSCLALSSTNRVVTRPLPASNIGDVTGPALSTDNAIVRFDGTSGKLIQNSGVTIDDTGTITLPALSSGIIMPSGYTLQDLFIGSGIQTWVGPWASGQVSNWNWERIGNMCFVSIDGVSFVSTLASAISSTVALPIELRPNITKSGILVVFDNSNFVIGSWRVNSSGIILIYPNASQLSTFANIGTAGFFQSLLSYSI